MPRIPKFPLKDIPKPPRISQILKKTNPVRGVVEDAREGIKAVREEISGIASALRVEEEEPEKEKKSEGEEGCLPCEQMHSLQEFLSRRKVDKALSELEKSGDKANVDIIKKYIGGEDVG